MLFMVNIYYISWNQYPFNITKCVVWKSSLIWIKGGKNAILERLIAFFVFDLNAISVFT